MDKKSDLYEAEMRGKLEGKAEGKLEGKLEGKAEGKLEGKLEAARNALIEGIEPNIVAKITGLSLKTVDKLKKELTN